MKKKYIYFSTKDNQVMKKPSSFYEKIQMNEYINQLPL